MRKFLFLLLAGLFVAVPQKSFAQPPDEEGSTMDVEALEIGQEWERLHSQNELVEIRDPKTAIARYESFYATRGVRSPSVSIPLLCLIAQLYKNELGNKAKAEEILQSASDKYNWHRNSSKIQQDLKALRQNQPRIPLPIHLRVPSYL